MGLSYSHGREFVSQIRPLLEQRDAGAVDRFVRQFWPEPALRDLLSCEHPDAVKAALVCLSIAGDMADNPAMAALLGDDDSVTAAYAEYAMWATWFRGADERSRGELCQAVQLISENDIEAAIACLNRLLAHRPDYAEAYNQRAIAYFLKEDYLRSMADCQSALRLNPYHFGAVAGLGHCYAAFGRLPHALAAYRHALRLHPRLEGVRESIGQIRLRLTRGAPRATLPESTSPLLKLNEQPETPEIP